MGQRMEGWHYSCNCRQEPDLQRYTFISQNFVISGELLEVTLRRNATADSNEPDVAVVIEQYTADCMSYQFVVNPNQRQYYIEGQREALSIKDPLVSAPSATTSLPPKPDGKPGKKPELRGNPCVQNLTGNEGNANLSTNERAQNDRTAEVTRPVPTTGSGKCNEIVQDALDEAIEESKAVKDLVCS